MALREPTLSGATTVVGGALYVVNGVPTVAPSTQAVTAWAAAIGGSPTIASIDYIGRRSVSPFAPGTDIFGT